MRFPEREWLLILVLSLVAVPLQMSLMPLLELYVGGTHLTVSGTTLTLFADLDLQGTSFSVWLTTTIFGLPLAIFLLTNHLSMVLSLIHI